MNPSFSGELSSVGTEPRAKSLLLVLSLLAAAAFAAWNLSSWPDRLRYPADLAHIEGMRLAEIRHFRQGLPVYAPASAERFDAMIYGPLYYFLGAQLVDPERPSYLPLRLLGMIATLGLAAAAALFAWWLTGRFAAALLAPMLFLSFNFVSLHGISVRCDMVALFLAYSGFLVAWRHRDSPGILAAAPLMLLALFYKQQFFAAPAAVFVFLFLEKRYGQALRFSAFMGGGILTGMLFFQFVVFRQGDFLLHWVGYNLMPFSWTILLSWALVGSFLLCAPVVLALKSLRRFPDRLLTCYLLILLTFTIASLGKVGSGPNYYLELTALLAPLASTLVIHGCHERRDSVNLGAALAVLAVSLAGSTRIANIAPRPEDFVRDLEIQDYLRENFKPGTDAAAFYTGRLLRAGLATPISDLYVYSWLACTGKIDEADWKGQFESRRFGALLLTTNLHNEAEVQRGTEVCLSEAVRRSILQNYELRASLDLPFPERAGFGEKMFVWVPRAGGESRVGAPLRHP